MNRTKNIKIQLWQDSRYLRVIGLWYPDVEPTQTTQSIEPILVEQPINPNVPTEVQIPQDDSAPYIIVNSIGFEPRAEVMGGNPIAIGQSPVPKDIIENAVRNMSYLFANEISMFQPKTKALAKTFIAKQTVSYTMIKEVPMTVTPVQGAMSLKDLKDFINQFSDEEQKKIQVINNVEKPVTTAGKHIDEFIFGDKTDQQSMYITVTKLDNIYETEDPYIRATQLPENPKDSLTPGTEDAPMSKVITKNTVKAIDTDTIERETLKTFDDMTADETIETKPSREKVLEQLLLDKNQELIDGDIIPPTIPLDVNNNLPNPTQESGVNTIIKETPLPTDQQTADDLAYAALTQAPQDVIQP